jgi:hypothetical protein
VLGETKKKKISTKILNQLHSCVDTWLYLPSDDTAKSDFYRNRPPSPPTTFRDSEVSCTEEQRDQSR